MNETSPPSYDDVAAAARRIAPHIHKTPVFTCRHFDALCGARFFFKCENLQKVGAFKARGAVNAALRARHPEEGFVTHSSGNHGQALAYAAQIAGGPARVVIPEGANEAKIEAIRHYGAELIRCGPTNDERAVVAENVLAARGGAFVHPFADRNVIAGQGTCARELLGQVPDLEAVIAPIGGGGLIAGTCLAIEALSPETEIYAAEPAAVADAARSKKLGRIEAPPAEPTIADGLRAVIAPMTFAFLRDQVEAVLTCEEEAIASAMRTFWLRAKLLIEASSAVAIAAMLAHREVFAGKRVGVILTGGNVDLEDLPWR